MAKFCSECGSPTIDANSQFCSNCGAKIPVMTSTEQTTVVQKVAVKQPTQPSSYIPPVSSGPSSVQTPVQQQQGPMVEGATKKRSTLEWIAICCGGVILLVVVSAFLAGMASNMPSGSSSNDKIINQDLSSMALTINDLPTGWKTYGTPKITPNIYSCDFVKVEMLTPYVVYLNITRYPTVEQAKAEYNLEKAEITQFKVESVNLGNEGFGYVDDDSSIVVFRAGNIITSTQYGVGGFGASSSFLSISDARDYAKIVANRIKS